MPDSPITNTLAVRDLQEELRAEQENTLLLTEAIADLERAMVEDETGWEQLAGDEAGQFSRDGLRKAAKLCRVMAVANPLIRRSLQLRIAYIWGQGVSIVANAGDDDDAGQDVNAVVQEFLDDESNRTTLTGSQAREEFERALGTDGNLFPAFFTNPRTGRVQARSIPADEIDRVISNPEDRKEPWFYLRIWQGDVVRPYQEAGGQLTTRVTRQKMQRLYPALGYRPVRRPKVMRIGTDDVEIAWNAPVKHISVNRLDGWTFGIGDAYTAVNWAKAYKEFLTDWAKLVKALSRFAWRATSDHKSKAQDVAAKLRASQHQPVQLGGRVAEPPPVGGTVSMGPGQSLEAIPKTGATIDSESGRPLAAMVAAAMGIPVTMLLADPGVTGARATAETLDQPTENEMRMRQTLWADTYRDILAYVIDQAVKAPLGPLKGTIGRDLDGREVITLTGGPEGEPVDRTVSIEFPNLSKIDVKTLVDAIVAADGTGKPPELLIVRLLLQAFGVKDADEWIQQVTDPDTGEFIDRDASAGQAAVDEFRGGRDPAELVR